MSDVYVYDEIPAEKNETPEGKPEKKQVEKNDEPSKKVSAKMEQAMSQGWRPKDEWTGPEDDWIDHNEFLVRGELMGRISEQSGAIKGLKGKLAKQEELIKKFGEHHKKVAEIEFKRALAQLKQQKAAALADGEHDAAVEIDDQISDLKNDFAEAQKDDVEDDTTTDETQGPPQVVVDWVNSPANNWYRTEDHMAAYADRVFDKHLAETGGDFAGALKKAETAVHAKFSTYFNSDDEQAPTRRGAVAEPSDTARSKQKKAGSKKTISAKDLSEEQRDVGKEFVNQGLIESLDVYAAELFAMGEIE